MNRSSFYALEIDFELPKVKQHIFQYSEQYKHNLGGKDHE